MALTNDGINEILELYVRGHSGRKIADKTEHSPVTIYYHIRQAKERVTSLIVQGMGTDQILSQLDYPVSFVNRVIKETDAMVYSTITTSFNIPIEYNAFIESVIEKSIEFFDSELGLR